MKGKKQKNLITEELTWEQHVICGNNSYESGRIDEALLEYDKALILNPNNSLVYHNRGILYYNMEKNQEALLDYNKAIELNPQDSKIYNNRGNLYQDLGRQEDAINDFNQAINLDPNFSDAYNSRAMLYVDLGKNDEALDDFNQAIKLKAQSNIFKNRGILLFNLNRFVEALQDFKEAISLTQNDSTLYLNAAIILQALKRNQEALENYNLSIKLNSNDQRAYKSRGNQYSTRIQEKSNQLYLTFLKQYCQNQMTLMHTTIEAILLNYIIANQYWKQNQLNLALQDFNQSIRLNPKYQNAYDCRGCLFLELGENGKAESDFNKSIELNSKSSNSYNNLGNFQVNIGNYEEALKNYQDAIQLDTQNSIYFINLGELYLRMNNFQQAFIFFQQANLHIHIIKPIQLSSLQELFEKMLLILLEIFTEIEKENILIENQPLESKIKLDSINEIKQIETSVENQLKIILQPISLQSNQHQLNRQIEQLHQILEDTRIKISLIHQSLKKEQQLETNQEQHQNQQIMQNSNISTIQSGITNLKSQNNNKYLYFKSLCCNLISFMSFCFEIQQAILPQCSIQKSELIPNVCTFKEENYIFDNNLKESLFETICEAIGYQDNFKEIIINRNFAQLYQIENDQTGNLEVEFHLLAIDLATKQQDVPEILTFFDFVEKISNIQMKELQIASNIFWKKGILDSIKIIQFIDNNINKIVSDGLQYLRMWKEEFEEEELIVHHQSLTEQMMPGPSINQQPTYCSFCQIQ
ncbi:unnamed protein product [Paramecium octaurelia]|uniref:Tetratricopeptide repeat protein n=1 Tax=Paramecium octaurelia TaxID=43137 RepID=A0A8S1WFZ6_PAROT|nr:unnamed protein product [Paramecium octaurelia]